MIRRPPRARWHWRRSPRTRFDLLRYTHTALAGLVSLWLRWLSCWPGGGETASRWGPRGDLGPKRWHG
eukprot:14928675-Alexandrium_andersonii.AAC.1